MITNASFRTKKLPDDITVAQVTEGDTGIAGSAAASIAPAPLPQLVAISEEHDEPIVGVKVKEATSFRLPEFSSLVKKKSKQPKAVKTRSNNGSILSNDGNVLRISRIPYYGESFTWSLKWQKIDKILSI